MLLGQLNPREGGQTPLDYAEVLDHAKRASHSFNIFDNRLLGVGKIIFYKI